MQTEKRLFDDLARMAQGAIGTIQGVRGELDARLREQVTRFLAGMNLVEREEFDVVKAMAAAARAENEQIKARLALLEARFGPGDPPPSSPAGPSG